MNMMSMFQNNPMFQRAQQMVQGKSEQEIEQIASNLCKQRGININDAFEQFKNSKANLVSSRYKRIKAFI